MGAHVATVCGSALPPPPGRVGGGAGCGGRALARGGTGGREGNQGQGNRDAQTRRPPARDPHRGRPAGGGAGRRPQLAAGLHCRTWCGAKSFRAPAASAGLAGTGTGQFSLFSLPSGAAGRPAGFLK